MYWQVSAVFPSGGVMLCGVAAPTEEAARSVFRELMAWVPSKAFPAVTVTAVPAQLERSRR